MADRTVRAIFEARVSGAQKGMRDLAKDVDGAGRKVDSLSKDLKGLDGQKVAPKIDLAIKDAERQIKDLTLQLGDLRTMEVTPEVTADIKKAERSLADAKKALRELNGAKAEMKVTADTSPAKREVKGLADDIGDAGQDAGDEAGMGIAGGIVDALRTIPIAGAVIGVGVAIAGGILLGIKQGLQIEAERDIFSAQTGLDEDTSARFGRAAGEAYANAWGDSVAANLDTAKMALRAGIIDSEATDAEIENVIAKLQGLNDLFEYDIETSVRGVGNLMRTGLVKDADQAFDLIVAASRKVSSDDLIDTVTEYSNQFTLLGLNAEQTFGVIAQLSEAGARDTDIIADLFKEMGLRIREGTDPAIDGLKRLGLNADDIVKAFQRGGPDAVTAIDKVFTALRKMEEKGGNTQAVIAALFGGPGEDLGSALFALDLDNVSDSLGGVDAAAGAADTALSTMSANTSTKMETARRNVELAMDGIKGALAAAFGEEIGGAADWVTKNRAPLMEFFLDVINGAFDMGIAFAEFSATALDAIADVVDSAADILVWLPGYSVSDKAAMKESADGIRGVADAIRTDIPSALDAAREKANDWAAPEILKAKLHDATEAMKGDMDVFSAAIEEAGGTVTINGDALTAEEALAELTESIDAETGTVTINGDAVPAEDALDVLMALVGASAEDVTIGGDVQDANGELSRLKSKIDQTAGSVKVSASTAAAERALKALERTRYATLNIRVAGVTGYGGLTKEAHEGGWTGVLPGRHAGGRVPGSDPGYDNILWPLNSGGRTLQQPLAGGEYVVNSKDAAYWAPVLEMMNAGQRPTSTSETVDQRIDTITVYANTFDEIERKAREKQRIANLGRRRA